MRKHKKKRIDYQGEAKIKNKTKIKSKIPALWYFPLKPNAISTCTSKINFILGTQIFRRVKFFGVEQAEGTYFNCAFTY